MMIKKIMDYGLNVLKKKDKIIDESAPRYADFKHRLWAITVDMFLLFPIINIVYMFSDKGGLEVSSEVEQAFTDAQNGLITSSDAWFMLWNYWLESGGVASLLGNSATMFVVFGGVFIFMWRRWSASPGKLLFGLKIVDMETLEKPKLSQLIIRYIGYYISIIFFGLGFIWVGLNKKKRSWHDYLSRTVVMHVRPLSKTYKQDKFRRQSYLAAGIFIIFIIYQILA